jgi:hypothetical protein
LSLFLYCICGSLALRHTPPPPPADVPVTLRWLHADDLAALVAPAPIQDDIAAMLAFGDVVEHYHARLTVVPMRYGSRLPGPGAVVAHLNADHDRYTALLDLLDGCVEMGLRLPLAPAAASGPQAKDAATSGRDYLLRRRAELAVNVAAEAALDRLDDALGGLFRRRRREQGWFAGQQRLSVQYLVPRMQLDPFQERLRDAIAAGRLPGAPDAVLTSGPWPPYSFAATDAIAAAAETLTP